jgi:hypothetical protein
VELAHKALPLDVTWESATMVVGAQGPVYSSSFVLVWWCFDTFVWWFRFCKIDVRLFAGLY